MLEDPDGAHIFSCPCLGGQIRPHDEVKFVLAHLVKQCGVTSTVPMTEVRVRLRWAERGTLIYSSWINTLV